MTFLPLVLWGIYEVLWGDCKKWYLLMLGMAGYAAVSGIGRRKYMGMEDSLC